MSRMVTVIIPVYNEEKALGGVIDRTKEAMEKSPYDYEIIVVDDGSTDGSYSLAMAKGVKVVQHEICEGTGAARKSGIKNAQGDIIVMIDGDGSYPEKDIPRLVKEIEDCDMVVGARNSEKGTLRLIRSPAKWFIRRLASYLAERKIPDLNSGLRAFKKDIAMRFLPLLPATHSWVSTITLLFLCNGYRIKYLPIEYRKRLGKSSFHPIRDTYNYVSLVIRTITYFNPLKVFLPVSLTVLLVGLLSSVYHLMKGGTLQEIDIILILIAVLIGMMGLLADLIVMEHKK